MNFYANFLSKLIKLFGTSHFYENVSKFQYNKKNILTIIALCTLDNLSMLFEIYFQQCSVVLFPMPFENFSPTFTELKNHFDKKIKKFVLKYFLSMDFVEYIPHDEISYI